MEYTRGREWKDTWMRPQEGRGGAGGKGVDQGRAFYAQKMMGNEGRARAEEGNENGKKGRRKAYKAVSLG